MGKSSGGSQGTPGTQTVVNQSSPPQAFLDAYTNLAQRAANQSQAPLQQYPGETIAPLSLRQQESFNTIDNVQGAYSPYIQAATQNFANATTPLWAGLPQFDTSTLPNQGIGALEYAQQYLGDAGQVGLNLNVSPYTGLASNAAIGAGFNAPQYANMATGAAFGLDTTGQQNLATGAATGIGQAVPQFANYAAQAAQGINPAPYQNFVTQAAAGLGQAVPQFANFAAQAAQGLDVSPYQNLATHPLTTQGYGALPEYLSPYTQNVTSALQGLFNQQNAQQLNQVRGNAAAQGALGGDREAVAEALTAQQQQLAESPVLAQALQQGFQQAQQELNQQQQLQLQQGVSQGQLGLGAGQLGVSGAGLQGQLGLGAGQLLSQAGTAQGQLGLGAGQLGIQGGAAQGQLGLGAAQALTQAGTAQGQLGLGAGNLANQTAAQQIQAAIASGQLMNQAAATQGQLGLGAAGATTQAAGTQGQLELGAAQASTQAGQALLNEFNQQQQAKLAADQANAWLSSQAAFGLGNLGQLQQQLGLSGAAAQQQAGAIQQAQVQQQLNRPFEEFLQAQAFPYQQLNFLAPIVEGLGSQAGGTSATTSPGPSPISQIAGLGLAGVGTAGLLNQTGAFSGLGGLFGGAAAGDQAANFFAGAAAAGAPTFDIGSAIASALPLGGVARGGRIGHQGGGIVKPIQPDPSLGLPAVPGIDLSYMQPLQTRGLGGAGPPKAAAAPASSAGFDPSQILKDLNTAESVIKLSGLGSPTSEARGGEVGAPPGLVRGFHPHLSMPALGNAPHLGATGIGLAQRYPALGQRFQAGGMADLAAAAPLSGTSPNQQTFYQELTQMPMEKLQELSLRVPPTTQQGQMIQRALQAKRMTPQIQAPLSLGDTGAAAVQPTPGYQGGGLIAGGPAPRANPGGAAFAPRFQMPLGLYSPSLVQARNPLANVRAPFAALPTSAPIARNPLENVPTPSATLPTFNVNARNALSGVPAPSPALPTAFGQFTLPPLNAPPPPPAAPVETPFDHAGGPLPPPPPNPPLPGPGMAGYPANVLATDTTTARRGGFIRPHRQEGGGLADDPDRDLRQQLDPARAAVPIPPRPAPLAPATANSGTPVPRDLDLHKATESVAIPLGHEPPQELPEDTSLSREPTQAGPETAPTPLPERKPDILSPPAASTEGAPDQVLPVGQSEVLPYNPDKGFLSATGMSPEQYDTYRRYLARRESSGYAEPPNKEGYMGRYQMGKDEIKEAAARLGIPVPSQQEFLSDSGLQEKLFENYTQAHHNELMSNPIYANASPQQRAAILAGAHLGGVNGVNGYLAGRGDPADRLGTHISSYVNGMAQAINSGLLPPIGTPRSNVGMVRVSDTSQPRTGGISTIQQDTAIAPRGEDETFARRTLSNPWMAAIATGAGMLASRSPWPGVALGEGLLTGTHFLGQQEERENRYELAQARVDFQKDLTALRGRGLDLQAQRLVDLADHYEREDRRRKEQGAENASIKQQLADAATQNARTHAVIGALNADKKPLSWYDPATNKTGYVTQDPNTGKYDYSQVPQTAQFHAQPSTMLTGQQGLVNMLMTKPGPNGAPPVGSAIEALGIMKDPSGANHQRLELAARHQAEYELVNGPIENMTMSQAQRDAWVKKKTQELLGTSVAATAQHAAQATPQAAPQAPAAAPAQPAKVIQNGWRYRLENGQYTPVGPAQ